MDKLFNKFSATAAGILGRAWVFCIALLLVLGWLIGGLFFGFSDVYQLVINTTTTIITFLMVFIIQNTQNRSDAALQLKIDELIKATDKAHNTLRGIEKLSDKELAKKSSKKK